MGIYICVWLQWNQDGKYAEKVENKRIAICEVLANLDFRQVTDYMDDYISIHEALANLDLILKEFL